MTPEQRKNGSAAKTNALRIKAGKEADKKAEKSIVSFRNKEMKKQGFNNESDFWKHRTR